MDPKFPVMADLQIMSIEIVSPKISLDERYSRNKLESKQYVDFSEMAEMCNETGRSGTKWDEAVRSRTMKAMGCEKVNGSLESKRKLLLISFAFAVNSLLFD
jgi:hypothetical protein